MTSASDPRGRMRPSASHIPAAIGTRIGPQTPPLPLPVSPTGPSGGGGLKASLNNPTASGGRRYPKEGGSQ